MLRPRLLSAVSVLAAVLILLRCAPASAQGLPQPHDGPSLGLAALRPLHWGLQTKTEPEPAAHEIPQGAYLSFYVTGAVLIVLGSSLALYSTVRLYDAVQRSSTADEVEHAMAVGAEGLLALVGLAFVVLGGVLQSDEASQHRPPAAGTIHAFLGPTPGGPGAFGALTVTF